MSTRRNRRAKQRRRFAIQTVALILLWAAVLGILLWAILGREKRTEPPAQTTAAVQTSLQTTEAPQTEAPTTTEEPTTVPPTTEAPSDDWKLILVNRDVGLPEDFTVTLKELRNNQRVDERIYPELQQMFDDARAAGLRPLINESFRTAADQQDILDRRIAQHKAEGLSQEEAETKALAYVALPGYSEHQTGLALDIISETGDATAVWQWLRVHARDYGFILRYPEGKEDLTHIAYEAWHYRYVGVEAAREIEAAGLCLEEYLAQTQPDGE